MDRPDYQVGDLVCLREVIDGQPTGAEITYIFYGGGFDLDRCIETVKEFKARMEQEDASS